MRCTVEIISPAERDVSAIAIIFAGGRHERADCIAQTARLPIVRAYA